MTSKPLASRPMRSARKRAGSSSTTRTLVTKRPSPRSAVPATVRTSLAGSARSGRPLPRETPTPTRPPWASTNAFAMARPRPARPPPAPRWKRSNISSRWSGGTPGPESETASSIASGDPRRRVASTRISRAGRAVPGGVLEQVRQRLGDEGGVDLGRREVGGDHLSQAGGVECAVHERSGFVDEVLHHDRLAFRASGTCLEPPEVEHGADEAGQAIGLLLDRLEQFTTGRVCEHYPRLSQVGYSDFDRGERRAQIVGDRADERGAPRVDLLEKIGAQCLVAQLRPLDGEGGVVGVGREQGTIVDVERPASQHEKANRAPGGCEGNLAQQSTGDDASGQRSGRARSGHEPFERLTLKGDAHRCHHLEITRLLRRKHQGDRLEVEGSEDARGHDPEHLARPACQPRAAPTARGADASRWRCGRHRPGAAEDARQPWPRGATTAT